MDRAPADLAPDRPSDDPLEMEVLVGQRLRATILAGVFGGTTVMLVVFVIADGWIAGTSLLPPVLPVFSALLAVQQLAIRRAIAGTLAGGASLPGWVWYCNSFVELGVVTLLIAVMTTAFDDPLYALMTPTPWVYFLFVILSTLWLDPHHSIFVGAAASVQYLLLSLVLFGDPVAGTEVAPLFVTPFPWLAKCVLLLASGLGSAFVARELGRRLSTSVAAAVAQDRAERANEAKTAFLSNMSHEIRTPLNAVLGYVQLLERDPSMEDRDHYLQTIGSAGAHLLGVVNDVLDLARIESGREEVRKGPVDLGTLLRQIEAMFELQCRDKGLEFEVRVRTPVRRVLADERRLRQVLVNLLGNAVRFTPEGTVTLEVRAAPGGLHHFEVADTGPGIPADRQAAIFDPFQQEDAGLREGGSGLGLAIADAHARLMGGRLTLDATPGAGSRFTLSVSLPPAPGAVESAGGRTDRPPRAHPVSAVVVDGVPGSRRVLARAVALAGAGVHEARSAREALERVGERTPHLVFLDVDTSISTSDPATLALFDQARARTGFKVVGVSASLLEHRRTDALRTGFDDFLAKPLDFEEVEACISRLLDLPFGHALPPDPEPRPPAADGPRSGVPIPEPLLHALAEAATAFDVTELGRRLDDVDALGTEVRPFATHLRTLLRRYDMEGVLAALDRKPEASGA